MDAKGVTNLYSRAKPFTVLGYRVAVLRDDDKQPDATLEAAFEADGYPAFRWRAGRALEDELFQSLSDAATHALLEKAVAWYDEALIDAHLKSATQNALGLADCRGAITAATRNAMAAASKSKNNGWFKSVGGYEEVAREIVGPNLDEADPAFRDIVTKLGEWMTGAS